MWAAVLWGDEAVMRVAHDPSDLASALNWPGLLVWEACGDPNL